MYVNRNWNQTLVNQYNIRVYITKISKIECLSHVPCPYKLQKGKQDFIFTSFFSSKLKLLWQKLQMLGGVEWVPQVQWAHIKKMIHIELCHCTQIIFISPYGICPLLKHFLYITKKKMTFTGDLSLNRCQNHWKTW